MSMVRTAMEFLRRKIPAFAESRSEVPSDEESAPAAPVGPPEATTLAIGEEGEEEFVVPPEPVDLPETTMAIGEEGEEEFVVPPAPEPIEVSTDAVGEEGEEEPGVVPPEPIDPPEMTTLAIGEEGEEEFVVPPEPIGPPEMTTMAIGEDGDLSVVIDPDSQVGGPGWEPGPVDESTHADVDAGFGAGAPTTHDDSQPDPIAIDIDEEPPLIGTEPEPLEFSDETAVDAPIAPPVEEILVEPPPMDDDPIEE